MKHICSYGDANILLDTSKKHQASCIIETPNVLLPSGYILIGEMKPDLINLKYNVLPIGIGIEAFTNYHAMIRELRAIGDKVGTQSAAYNALDTDIHSHMLKLRKEPHPVLRKYAHVSLCYVDPGPDKFKTVLVDPLPKRSLWPHLHSEYGVDFDDYTWSLNLFEALLSSCAEKKDEQEEPAKSHEGYACFVLATVDDIDYVNISHSWSGRPNVLDDLPHELQDAELFAVIPGSARSVKELQRRLERSRVQDNWFSTNPDLERLMNSQSISLPDNN